jgi:hypothetical protein
VTDETEAVRKDAPEPPVLEISTIAPVRPQVKITTPTKNPGKQEESKLYELRVRSEFGARQWFSLQRDIAEHDRLAQTDEELNDAQTDRAEELATRLVESVLIAPKRLLSSLTYRQSMDVVLTFQLLQYASQETPENETANDATVTAKEKSGDPTTAS